MTHQALRMMHTLQSLALLAWPLLLWSQCAAGLQGKAKARYTDDKSGGDDSDFEAQARIAGHAPG